jgi:hypothetical protein
MNKFVVYPGQMLDHSTKFTPPKGGMLARSPQASGAATHTDDRPARKSGASPAGHKLAAQQELVRWPDRRRRHRAAGSTVRDKLSDSWIGASNAHGRGPGRGRPGGMMLFGSAHSS